MLPPSLISVSAVRNFPHKPCNPFGWMLFLISWTQYLLPQTESPSYSNFSSISALRYGALDHYSSVTAEWTPVIVCHSAFSSCTSGRLFVACNQELLPIQHQGTTGQKKTTETDYRCISLKLGYSVEVHRSKLQHDCKKNTLNNSITVVFAMRIL